jgi:hypothetical protein
LSFMACSTWVCKSGFDFQTRRISRVRKSNPNF